MAKTGIDLFLDLLADHGVRYIFGNPGSTELPLNDALTRDDRFQYVLGLQEVPVMKSPPQSISYPRLLGSQEPKCQMTEL